MAVFQYVGRDAGGARVTGRHEAGNAGQVAAFLSERQITPVSITQERGAKPAEDSAGAVRLRLLQRVKLDELIIFSRQMYSLTKAGIPITRAMRGLALSVRNPLLSETLNAVTDDLEQGHTLSGSLNHHPKVFSSLYVSLIHVGENTGNLDQAFLEISKYLELERQTIKNIKQATRYPLFVMIAIGAAIAVINLFVIPAFEGVFRSLGAELPWQTRALIATSGFTRDYWYLIVGGFVGALYAFKRYVATEPGRLKWDRLKLRLPVVGGLFQRITLGRFSRTFALVMRAGIPIEQALTIVSTAVGNAYIGDKVRGMRQGIERGEGFTRTAHATGMFSPLVLQMLAVGEETGNIDDLLEEAADFYEQEVEYDLKGLASAIEPILIVAIGFMVLVLALGVFLPLWELNASVNR
ncbi:type II secretion system F family protein [Motiliproteus sp. SC1-56]|uniref:type II secretion system F family protein n=1 Tax=Motiliproteus sp. SC1-56 TaxID=2799565 RepID=UPI001A8D94E8|nr:type II secretion system F family protein [Motiliproteus sp. SC1-56]